MQHRAYSQALIGDRVRITSCRFGVLHVQRTAVPRRDTTAAKSASPLRAGEGRGRGKESLSDNTATIQWNSWGFDWLILLLCVWFRHSGQNLPYYRPFGCYSGGAMHYATQVAPRPHATQWAMPSDTPPQIQQGLGLNLTISTNRALFQ
jgi:hypothetical protein